MKVLNPFLLKIISTLLEEEQILADKYNTAIHNGEKFEILRDLYINWLDADRRLRRFF